MLYQVNKKDCLFFTAFAIYLSVLVLSFTSLGANDAFNDAAQYIRYFCYLLAVIKILIDLYSEKNVWKICIVLVLVVISAIQMSSNTYLFYLIMILAARNVNCRRIIQCACVIQGAVLAAFVLGSQLGLTENYLFIQANGRYRYGLGFLYTTYAPILFFFFMMAYVYLRRERMRIYEFVVLEAINYWFFFMTDSRLSFYLSSILLVYVFIMRYFWQNREERIRKNRWLILAPAAACVGSICMQVFYNSESTGWVTLNNLLNGRLSWGRAALDQYPITWFGQNITWIGNARVETVGEYNYVDCSYLKILLESGIVVLILVVAAYTYMMYLAVKANDFYLQTILLFIVVFSMTEPRLVSIAFNPFLLLAATAFRTRDTEELFRKEPLLVPGFKIRATQIRLKDRDWVRQRGASWKKII